MEVALAPFTFKTLPMDVEPVIVRLPEPVMLPATTPANVEVAPVAVRDEPTFRFPVVVMNPVFEMPVWVELPETVNCPEMVALFEMSTERAMVTPWNVEDAVVDVAIS